MKNKRERFEFKLDPKIERNKNIDQAYIDDLNESDVKRLFANKKLFFRTKEHSGKVLCIGEGSKDYFERLVGKKFVDGRLVRGSTTIHLGEPFIK